MLRSPLGLAVLAAATLFTRPALAQAREYVLLVYETPAAFAARTDSTEAPTYWQRFAAFGEEMARAGVLVGGNALQAPSTARTVFLRGGKPDIGFGPPAGTPLQQGGYFVIRVATHEEAIAWARRCPVHGDGAVEVRPVHVRQMQRADQTPTITPE